MHVNGRWRQWAKKRRERRRNLPRTESIGNKPIATCTEVRVQISTRSFWHPRPAKKLRGTRKTGELPLSFVENAPVTTAVPRRCNEARPALPLSVSEGCGRSRSLHTGDVIKDIYMTGEGTIRKRKQLRFKFNISFKSKYDKNRNRH